VKVSLSLGYLDPKLNSKEERIPLRGIVLFHLEAQFWITTLPKVGRITSPLGVEFSFPFGYSSIMNPRSPKKRIPRS